jgi:hypothetical protein
MVELDELIALSKKVELLQQMAEEFVRTSPYTHPPEKADVSEKVETTMPIDLNDITVASMRDPEKAKAAGAAIRAALGGAEPGKKPKVAPFDIKRITVQEMQDPATAKHAAAAIMQALHPDDYEG